MTTKNMRTGPTRDFQVRIQKHDSNTKTRLYVTIPKGVVSVKAYDNEKVRGIPEGTDLVINGHMYGEEGKIPDFVILKIVKYGRLDTENKQKAKAEERDGKVVWLKEPADGGYKYRPRTGNIIIKNNKAYEVISSEYHDTDGFTVGVMNEEWYHIKARDVSDTQKGRELLRKEKSQKQDKKLLLNLELAQSRLVTAIIQKGKYYRGEMIEVTVRQPLIAPTACRKYDFGDVPMPLIFRTIIGIVRNVVWCRKTTELHQKSPSKTMQFSPSSSKELTKSTY